MNQMKPTRSTQFILKNRKTLNLDQLMTDIAKIQQRQMESLKEFYQSYKSYIHNAVYVISYDQNPQLILYALEKFDDCAQTLKYLKIKQYYILSFYERLIKELKENLKDIRQKQQRNLVQQNFQQNRNKTPKHVSQYRQEYQFKLPDSSNTLKTGNQSEQNKKRQNPKKSINQGVQGKQSKKTKSNRRKNNQNEQNNGAVKKCWKRFGEQYPRLKEWLEWLGKSILQILYTLISLIGSIVVNCYKWNSKQLTNECKQQLSNLTQDCNGLITSVNQENQFSFWIPIGSIVLVVVIAVIQRLYIIYHGGKKYTENRNYQKFKQLVEQFNQVAQKFVQIEEEIQGS